MPHTNLSASILLWLSLLGCAQKIAIPSDEAQAPRAAGAHADTSPPASWVLIDSAQDSISVFREGKAPVVFHNIAVGAAGVKEKTKAGDDVTPRGTYAIGWFKHSNKFLHFIGLTYPSREDAERGYSTGIIDRHTYERIVSALDRGRLPPQDTRLGGLIGIHGVGKGSLEIHRIANWTAGCIAVDNRQIQKLRKILTIGMRVEIR